LKTILERAIDLARMRGAQYADIRVVDTRTESLSLKNGATEKLAYSESIGFGVRVLVDGAWGFASSHELTNAEIDRVTSLAVEIARASALFPGGCIDIGPPVTSQGTYETPFKNLRFTQSYVQALADLEAIGKDTRLLLSSYGNLAARVLALKISRFNFTGAAV